MDRLSTLFHSFTGFEPESCRPLSPSGSRRRYFRLSAEGRSLIGVIGTDADENRAFITLSRHFLSKGLNVPEVVAVSSDDMVYLQEDLGDVVLYDRMSDGRRSGEYPPEHQALLCRVMSILPDIQYRGGEGLDFSVCYPDSEFNSRMVDFDLNYFKYCYLKTSGVEFNEVLLQDDFDRMKADLLTERGDSFMYRDFQARNVMLRDGELWFIDFQGGRKGPALYDVASFVWQAGAAYPHELRRKLVDAYYDASLKYHAMERRHFDERLRLFVLFRTLQVLGAYGFRGKVERKAHFLESIPPALKNLRELLVEPFSSYPYLTGVLRAMSCENEHPQEDGMLEVHVLSFSFRKGIPEDSSGNGGGYVFDCRSIHNPGKYPCYRQFTGLDPEVRKFLEDDGGISVFLDHASALVDAHVIRFVERGFSHLQVAFGCTGGRHRSAYSAQRMAEHLSGTPGVRVHLTHRELGIDIPDFRK